MNAPYFNFKDGKLHFDTKFVDNANKNYGSVSGFSLKSLLSVGGASERVPLVLTSVCGSKPAAEHSPDLVNHLLQRGVLLVIECSRFFHQPDEESQDVELHAGTLKCTDFARTFAISGGEQGFDDVENKILATLEDGKTILLRYDPAIFVEHAVEIIRFLENRNVEVVHMP